MKRLVVKPSHEVLERIFFGKDSVPFQYANWWLYHNGVDDLIKSPYDTLNPNYQMASENWYNLVVDLADMVGYKSDRVDVFRKRAKRVVRNK